MTVRTPPTKSLDGALLIRIVANSSDGVRKIRLPKPPDGCRPTVTMNGMKDSFARTIPDSYLIAGTLDSPATETATIDVLVTAQMRATHPDFVTALHACATKVFDLRMGPVRHVLASSLAQHLAAT